MRRFIVVVLDGFGIGAMDDTARLRPQDKNANTALHILEAVPDLVLPTLASLGLGNAILAAGASGLPPNIVCADSCCYGTHNLAHFGADTFWGHQELMGTKPLKGESAPILGKLPEITDALKAAGHRVRFYSGQEGIDSPAEGKAGILIVDECVTIGDNLETDLGDNFNVTAALDIVPFEEELKIGKLVRSLVRASRVIVFGGKEVGLSDLLNAYESRQGYAGINAPRSGVYNTGYLVQHLGYGVNAAVQVPSILAGAGIPTVLIGKAADIIENPGKNITGIDTETVLAEAGKALASLERGFVCVNVQETDLAGHRQNPLLYAEKLIIADTGIKRITDAMRKEDILVVTADHGNDPLIGHSRHTREKTPILVWGSSLEAGFLGQRDSLADTGATVCDYFGVPAPESGQSYLKLIKQR